MTSKETILDVVDTAPFVFYREVFTAYLANDQNWYLVLKDICDAIDIDHRAQLRRIKEDPVMFDFLGSLRIDVPYKETTRKQNVSALNLRRLPFWLGTIGVGNIPDENKRKKIILFQREFAEVAWQVFRSQIISEEILAEMDAYESPEQQRINEIFDEAARLRKKIADLTEGVEAAIEEFGEDMSDFSGRLGRLEARFAGVTFVNSVQQQRIKKMVTSLAMAKAEADKSKSKGVHFAETWDDLYQEFGIPAYAMLPEDRFLDAVSFLRNRWKLSVPERSIPSVFEVSDQSKMF